MVAVVAVVAARAHASIGDGIFEVASRVLREAASAPITEISGLMVSRGFNVRVKRRFTLSGC